MGYNTEKTKCSNVRYYFLFAALLVSSLTYSQSAKVYFVRPNAFVFKSNDLFIGVDGKSICKQANRKYSVHEVKPGEHVFTVVLKDNHAEAWRPFTTTLEAGKTYYLEVLIGRAPYCNMITQKDAEIVIKEDKLEEEVCQ